MNRKIKIADLKRFDVTEYLNSKDAIADYMNIILEENDPVLLAATLGDIARAKGMTELARDTGLSRESLYKSLSGERIPSADTLLKVIRALGMKLTVTSA